METNFMEDSKDLKKRILNMREANNINNEIVIPYVCTQMWYSLYLKKNTYIIVYVFITH